MRAPGRREVTARIRDLALACEGGARRRHAGPLASNYPFKIYRGSRGTCADLAVVRQMPRLCGRKVEKAREREKVQKVNWDSHVGGNPNRMARRLFLMEFDVVQQDNNARNCKSHKHEKRHQDRLIVLVL